MKRSLIAVAAAVSLLSTTTVADALIGNGSYKGTTGQNLPISFSVSSKGKGKKKKRYVSKIAVTLHFVCTDGDQFNARQVLGADGSRSLGPTPSSEKFRIRNGKWGFTATRRDGSGGYAVTGEIGGKRSRASGSAAGQFKFNENNQLDPNGAITCSSNTTYTAKR